MPSAYSSPIPSQPIISRHYYYPATTALPTAASHQRNQEDYGSTQYSPSGAGPRDRSMTRDFVFGTPQDYHPTSPPEELMLRGRERARSLTRTGGGRDFNRYYHSPSGPEWSSAAPPRAVDFEYGNQQPSRHSQSGAWSQPRSDHHHHHHGHGHDHRQYRYGESSIMVPSLSSSQRPSYGRRRSLSLPPQAPQYAYHGRHHGYYYPGYQPAAAGNLSTTGATRGTSVGAQSASTSWGVPATQTHGRFGPSGGFFSRLFGLRRHRSASVSRTMYYTAPQPIAVPSSTHGHRTRTGRRRRRSH